MARSEKLEELHQKLVEGVAQVTSSDDWKRYLDTVSKFHRYSANNTFLILIQRPDATQVAGYRKWQELGRQVRGGEKAISILAPITVKRKDEDTGEEKKIVLFKPVSVFDVSQTDGEPLPDGSPHLLTGDAPEAVWERTVALLHSEGWTVERGDCGQANGYTVFETRTIRVREDVEPLQALKTLVHEYAHSQLHEDHGEYRAHRGEAEVEAESVAYVVLSALDLDSSDYSFNYVAGWASQAQPDAVLASADRVIKTARKLLEWLDAEVAVAA